MLPNPGALGAAYRIVAKNQTVTTAFQTGYREGFAHDPEGNGVAFTIDRAIEQYQEERQYNWEDETLQSIDPANHWRTCRSGNMIDCHLVRRLVMSNFGCPIYQRQVIILNRDWVFAKRLAMIQMRFLAAGDYRHHIGINLRLDAKLALPTPDMFGLDYVSFILPDQHAMENILMNLDAAGLTDYDYNKDNQF